MSRTNDQRAARSLSDAHENLTYQRALACIKEARAALPEGANWYYTSALRGDFNPNENAALNGVPRKAVEIHESTATRHEPSFDDLILTVPLGGRELPQDTAQGKYVRARARKLLAAGPRRYYIIDDLLNDDGDPLDQYPQSERPEGPDMGYLYRLSWAAWAQLPDEDALTFNPNLAAIDKEDRLWRAQEYAEACIYLVERKIPAGFNGVFDYNYLENRPFLRALAALAEVHYERHNYREAARVHNNLLHVGGARMFGEIAFELYASQYPAAGYL